MGKEAEKGLLYLRDVADIEPPRERYNLYESEDIYRHVPPPSWVGLADEIWAPHAGVEDPSLDRMRQLIKRARAAKKTKLAGKAMSKPEDKRKILKRGATAKLHLGPAVKAVAPEDGSAEAPRPKPAAPPQTRALALLNHNGTELALFFMTIWLLFAEDLRVAAFSRPNAYHQDTAFRCVSLAVALIFAAELLLRSVAQQNYIFSFFFWLDVLAVGSIAPDVLPLFESEDDDEGDTDAAARAGRIARAGARVGRLLRLLRVVRVIKILFLSARGRYGQADAYQSSALGKELKSRISKITIVFILSLLIGDALLKVAFEKVVTDSWLETALAQLYLSSNASVVPGDPAAPQNTQFQRVFLPAFLTMFHRHYAFSGHRNILVRLNIFGFTYYSPLDSADMPPLASCTADAWGRPIGPYSGPRCQTIDGAEYGIARLNVAGTAGGPAAAVAQLMEWQDGPVHPSIAECTQAGCYPYAFNRGDFRGWYELGARQSNEQHRPMEPDDLPPPYDDASAFFPGCTNFSVFQDAQLSFRHCPWTIHHLRTDEMIPVVLHADGTTASVNNGFGGPADATIVAELWYAKRPVKVVESVQSVLFTLLVILVLGGVSLMLSRDAETMAIRPIERMVDAVTRLAANPALKLEAVAKVEYETDALYASLIKISSLLQVGFGEAGNNLVAENLKRGDTVDPMVPGKVIKGAFGFCIIDDYEEVLECLGEEILPFTNTAAGVVHTAVTANGGQANRNLGEAFLCVWKPNLDGLTKGVDYDDAPTPDRLSDLPPLGGKRVQAADTLMCDGALTAFRRSVRTIQSSPKLQAYNQHEEIVKWFDGQYTTQIGYGLNFGWAIEGAVGTSIKIDCSYLSPNVNLAARLESATKMYGVTILMSEYFVDKLSEAARLGLRRLDVVCLKGSSIPMSIYTCDRSNALYCSRPAVARLGAERVVAEFQRVFAKGLDGFVAGEWGRARAALQTALEICPHDKPAQRLMWHMDSRQANPEYGLSSVPFVAPEGWAGYHALLSK